MGVAVGVARHAREGLAAAAADEHLDPVARGADAVAVDVAAQVGELLAEPLPAAPVLDAGRVVVLGPRADREAEREPPAR